MMYRDLDGHHHGRGGHRIPVYEIKAMCKESKSNVVLRV